MDFKPLETYRYLLWLCVSWVPILVLWWKYSKILKPHFKVGLYLNALTFIPAIIWDRIAIKAGVWHFIPPFTGGLYNGMPIEEFILIASVPWFALVTTVIFMTILKDTHKARR